METNLPTTQAEPVKRPAPASYPRYQNPRDAGLDTAQRLDWLRKALAPSLLEPVEVWLVDFRPQGTGQLCTASTGSTAPQRYLDNLSKEDRAAVVGFKVIGTIEPGKVETNV